MFSARAKTLMISTTIFAALSFTACNPQNFSSVPADGTAIAAGTPSPTATPGTCTATNVEAILIPTKILFVVDTSGSNASMTQYAATSTCNDGYGHCLMPASDPNKAFRGGAISNFLTTYKHKTNFKWSFMTFADTSAHAYVNSGNDQSPIFSPDANVMQYALNSFYTLTDHGQTPYGAGIRLAQKAIQNDPDRNATQKPNYFVIFLTDGFPTDYNDNAGNFQSNALSSDIASLLSVAPGQVSLSTIYYGQGNDPSAIALLQSMASSGGGQFASVNDANTGFKIDDVIPGSSTGCP